MREAFKHIKAQVIAQFGVCMLLCGALIGILISTGGLLILVNEGRGKTFLLPSLLLLGIVLFFYIRQKRACSKDRCLTTSHTMLNMFLFMLVSMIGALLFTIYVFIPWWIPGYTGGFLLP